MQSASVISGTYHTPSGLRVAAAPSQRIVTIFGKFGGLADVIKCVKFRNDWSMGILRALT
jgi:hypothetical protein